DQSSHAPHLFFIFDSRHASAAGIALRPRPEHRPVCRAGHTIKYLPEPRQFAKIHVHSWSYNQYQTGRKWFRPRLTIPRPDLEKNAVRPELTASHPAE